LNKKEVKILLHNAHYYIDKFLRRGDPEPDIFSEFENDTNPDNTDTNENANKKPTKFEDKYLDEYRNLPDIELATDRLDSLKNNIIMENTPLGNVVMHYDSKKETFVFYSDLTIPYRYLEVVGRKYAITYNCKKLYVDMNEELKLAEEKKQKKLDQTQKSKFENASANESASTSKGENTPVKKDVFAKFKTYNNNTTKDIAAAPSKNTGSVSKKENENMLLKENANKYRYEGKIINFNFLQPINKKIVDKRLAMSWADFKKTQS
jgi:hypothetical protein